MRAEPAQNEPSVTTQGLEERDTKVFCALTKLFLGITGACEQGRRKQGGDDRGEGQTFDGSMAWQKSEDNTVFLCHTLLFVFEITHYMALAGLELFM